ncbi:MAG: CDP-alcohol phosphatidyltransferase family protein [Elusimicrobia bacterium]|nr:CDP-alcohol phosphatidyltransferase family protein [Elusimicrobiota bacterium]
MKNLTLPNTLTVLRIIAVPVFVISVLAENKWLPVFIFAFCILTDFFDGMLARVMKKRTQLGALLDPIADKFLLISSFIVFAALKKIPLWIPIVVITKDIIVFLGWWLRFHITGNSVVSPTFFGKATTVLEMVVIFSILINIFPRTINTIIYLMLFVIIISTLNYTFSGIKEIEKK